MQAVHHALQEKSSSYHHQTAQIQSLGKQRAETAEADTEDLEELEKLWGEFRMLA
jgi:hypothetical protein